MKSKIKIDEIEVKRKKILEKITWKTNIRKAIESTYNFLQTDKILNAQQYKKFHALSGNLCIGPKREPAISKDVKKRIEEIISSPKGKFKASVAFRPKGYKKNEKNIEYIDYRPTYYTNVIDMIAMTAILNIFIFKFPEKDVSDEKIDPNCLNFTLSQLSNEIPSSFYGYIPSLKFNEITKPWSKEYEKYSEKAVEYAKKYSKNGKYKYQLVMDFENYFPTIKAEIVWKIIKDKFGVEIIQEYGLDVLKEVFLKLVVLDVSDYKEEASKRGLTESFFEGLPQGLPQSYYFSNLFTAEVLGVIKEEFTDSIELFYVDDSVIFTNNIESQKPDVYFCEKIKKINSNLQKLGGVKLHLPSSTGDTSKTYYINLDEGSENIHNLHLLEKEASIVSESMYKSFDFSDDMSLYRKITSLLKLAETIKDENLPNIQHKHPKNVYEKKLNSLIKFYKYRKVLIVSRIPSGIPIHEQNQDEYFSILKDEMKNQEDSKEIIDELNQSILLYVLSYEVNRTTKERGISLIKKFQQKYSKSIKKDMDELEDDYYFRYSQNIRNIEGSSNKELDNYLKDIIKINAKEKEQLKKEIELFIYSLFQNNDIFSALEKFEVLKGVINNMKGFFPKYLLLIESNLKDILNLIYSWATDIIYSKELRLDNKYNRKIISKDARRLICLRNKTSDISNIINVFRKSENDETYFDTNILSVMNIFMCYVVSSELIDNLILVHMYTKDVWENGSKFLHFYTLHNQEHGMNLIENVATLSLKIDYFKLKKVDYYILFSSCYLHDIAMAIHPKIEDVLNESCEKYTFREVLEKNIDENTSDKEVLLKILEVYTNIDEIISESVRRNHPVNSANHIKKIKLELKDNHKSNIAEASKAHGMDIRDIYWVKSQANEQKTSQKYINVLLRLSDLLDFSKDRINNQLLNINSNQMGAISKYHWISHMLISNFKIENTYDYSVSPIDESKKVLVETLNIKINLNLVNNTGAYILKEEPEWFEKLTINRKEKIIEFSFSRIKEIVIFQRTEKPEELSFIEAWFIEKNEYLFSEIYELMEYLYFNDKNDFFTDIKIILDYSEADQMSSDIKRDILDYPYRKIKEKKRNN